MLGYNRMTGYNKARYNAEGTELSAADTITIADSVVAKNSLKTFTELIINSDATAKTYSSVKEENIKLDVWLSIDRDDANLWSGD